MKLSELQKEYGDITLSDSTIEKIKKEQNSVEPPSWLVTYADYYYIDDEGDITIDDYDDTITDVKRVDIGNIFQTRKEAEFEVERRKIEAKLLSLGGTRDGMNAINGTKYELIYHNGKLDIVGLDNFLHQGRIYFKDKENLRNAIKIIGENRIKKYLFNIEEKEEE